MNRQSAVPIRAKPIRHAPPPIPAFAPVERPELEEPELGTVLIELPPDREIGVQSFAQVRFKIANRVRVNGSVVRANSLYIRSSNARSRSLSHEPFVLSPVHANKDGLKESFAKFELPTSIIGIVWGTWKVLLRCCYYW